MNEMNNLSKRIEERKGMKEMKTAYGEIRIPVCVKVESREDGMELVELANRIHPMLVVMNKLVLNMVNGNKEEVDVLDIEIEWNEIFNKDGTHHSWFEMKDGVKHLIRAADIEKKKNS